LKLAGDLVPVATEVLAQPRALRHLRIAGGAGGPGLQKNGEQREDPERAWHRQPTSGDEDEEADISPGDRARPGPEGYLARLSGSKPSPEGVAT
jgi:hypothetical protein